MQTLVGKTRRVPKRQRAVAIQDASALGRGERTSRSVWSAARLPPLSHARGGCGPSIAPRPIQSGAEVIALQTLRDCRGAWPTRQRPGVRRPSAALERTCAC
jgi:hypothetical protein